MKLTPGVQETSSLASTMESPPPFSFKQGKTSLRARRLKMKKRQVLRDNDNHDQIQELVSYFKDLDNRSLGFA